MKRICLGLLALFLLGCEPPPAPKPRPNQNQPVQKSQAQDVIDTMTQRNSMDAGRRTAQKVRDISAQRNRDLQEAGGR